jgi:excisionase family DNA binding protein
MLFKHKSSEVARFLQSVYNNFVMEQKQKNLLSVRDAAERMNLSVQRIKQLIYDERLFAQKIGNQWIITEAALNLVKQKPAGRPASGKSAVK